MASFLTPTQLAEYWPGACGIPELTLSAQLAAASAIVRRKLPSIDANVESGAVDHSIIEMVVSSMVQRKLSDPVRMEQVSQAVFQYDTSWLAAGIFLTDDEKELLTPAPTGRGSKYGSMRPRIGLAP